MEQDRQEPDRLNATELHDEIVRVRSLVADGLASGVSVRQSHDIIDRIIADRRLRNG